MRKVYFDHSATTPVDPFVAEEMWRCLTEIYGNPSSVHSFGRAARKTVEEAREKIAAAMKADPSEIIFTSGGTEADNMAVIGVAYANRDRGNQIITSSVEHHAVLDTCHQLEKEGFKLTVIPVDRQGMVDPQDVAKAINNKTILITIMHANNEVGTIQPVSEIGRIAKERGVLFHTDAVQSIGKIKLDVNELSVDLLSISGHKIYGPKGAGALYVRKGIRWQPVSYGGGQERGRRPGTENVPGIVGLGKAVELVTGELEQEANRLGALKDKLVKGVLSNIEDTLLTGHQTLRLANHASFCFKFLEGESVVLALDMQGIAASSGSACTAGAIEPSHVLLAMGFSPQLASGSLRITLGKNNNEQDVDYFLEVLPEIVKKLREISPLRKKENIQPDKFQQLQL